MGTVQKNVVMFATKWGERVRAGMGRLAFCMRAGCFDLLGHAALGCTDLCRRAKGGVREEEGQGTTEYAILVGILVVIAILAIAVFRGRIQELWDSIASSINGL